MMEIGQKTRFKRTSPLRFNTARAKAVPARTTRPEAARHQGRAARNSSQQLARIPVCTPWPKEAMRKSAGSNARLRPEAIQLRNTFVALRHAYAAAWGLWCLLRGLCGRCFAPWGTCLAPAGTALRREWGALQCRLASLPPICRAARPILSAATLLSPGQRACAATPGPP